MRVTIDVPDDLSRLVEAKSALEGKRIGEVRIELCRRWISEGPGAAGEDSRVWLDGWLRLADEALKNAPDGPNARELLEEGRDRLERLR